MLRAGTPRAHVVELALILGACLAWPSAPALSQELASPPGSGSVEGRVVETDGTPVPGVWVLLEGPVPDRSQKRERADANARFRFQGLAPGIYRLAVELPGLAAPGDVEVMVSAGQTVQANAVLSLFAYDVEVQVVGRVPEDEALMQRAATARTFDLDRPLVTQLPIEAEQVLEVLPLLPGVVRGPTGLVSIGGSLPSDSAFLFNGADLIDPFSGAYRLQVPLEAVDNVQLTRGANAATYGDNIGGVVDVSTAGAGDEWETEVGSLIPRPWFRDGGLRGIKRFNPRLRFGGPLVPGRLYFSQSLEYHINRERVRDVPDDRGDHVLRDGWESLTQVDWRPATSRHRVSLMLLGFPENEDNSGLSGLTPVEATYDVSRDAAALLAEHRYRFDERSSVTTTVQLNRVALATRPIGFARGPLQVLPDRFEGAAFHRAHRATRHWQLRTVWSRLFGAPEARHSLQAGLDMHGLSTRGGLDNGPVEILGADGRLLERTVFLGGDQLRGSKRELSVFVQDRYRPSQRLWIDAGIRLSWDGAAGTVRAAPRAGFAWDVFGDTRTLLKASSGLLHRRVFLGEYLWERQPTRVVTRYDGPRASTHVLVPEAPERPGNPRAWVGSLELSHRVSDAWTVSARYTRRESRQRLVFDLEQGVAVTHDATADPLAIADGIAVDDRGALALANTGQSSYRDLEITAAWRVPAGHQVFLSYVRSGTEGDLNDFGRVVGEQPDPVLRPNARGRLPFDAPDRLIVWGRLYLPWELIVAPVLEWRSGFPWSALEEDQSYLGEPMTRRFPTYVQADINVTKGFRLAGRPLRLGIQLQNLTGNFNPRDVIASTASDRFGDFLNAQGMRIRFRSSARF